MWWCGVVWGGVGWLRPEEKAAQVPCEVTFDAAVVETMDVAAERGGLHLAYKAVKNKDTLHIKQSIIRTLCI